MSEFLDPSRKIHKHGEKLPHWDQSDAMQFVTFRLADAMPATKVRIWKDEHETWLKIHPKPWTPAQEQEHRRRFVWKLENWLDEGTGWMRELAVAFSRKLPSAVCWKRS
ncbi:MAG: hypothetical protein EOP88_22110 [Verrucomicrobiaceae bacterium]|nr:MAG: hypothetical protein EOP88_22110 [Verrucomicrobiaceae bacterium]